MKHNSDFRYDLEVGQSKENELAALLQGNKIEVKYDQKALKTGNIFVEYMSRGRLSGVSTSQAEWYCYAFGDNFHLVPAARLKNLCRKYLGTSRDVLGGDSNTSKGILLPIKELL